MGDFKFSFILKFMIKLLAITNEPSHALQRNDINIIIAMELIIDDVKAQLITMRHSRWEDFFDEVKQFCEIKCILVLDMHVEIPSRSRSRRERCFITNIHHYRVEIFYVTIDQFCTDMNLQFDEATNKILTCFSCLDPKSNFSKFDSHKIIRLVENL
jgi:hypothetical protein